MAWKHNLKEYKRKKDEQQRRQQIKHGLRPFLVCFTDNATHRNITRTLAEILQRSEMVHYPIDTCFVL